MKGLISLKKQNKETYWRQTSN